MIEVDQKTLNEHVVHRTYPVYPAIAKAAHFSGTVVLDVIVGTTGKLESIKPISGNSLLIPAATDCVKQWTYKPFEKEGQAASAHGKVSIIFSLGDDPKTSPPPPSDQAAKTQSQTVTITLAPPDERGKPDEEIATRYFDAHNECTRQVIAGNHDKSTADICRKAADIASEFAPESRYIEKRSAYVYTATAVANSGDLPAAIPYAKKAVAVVLLGHDDNSGSSAAYSILGQLEALTGDFAAADRDLTTSEDFERKGVTWADTNAASLAPSYRSTLAKDLRFHAELLKRLNRLADAQAKLDEASKL